MSNKYWILGILQANVERIIGSGDAKDVICSSVNKIGADTLVMGSHGYGFFKRYLKNTLPSIMSCAWIDGFWFYPEITDSLLLDILQGSAWECERLLRQACQVSRGDREASRFQVMINEFLLRSHFLQIMTQHSPLRLGLMILGKRWSSRIKVLSIVRICLVAWKEKQKVASFYTHGCALFCQFLYDDWTNIGEPHIKTNLKQI